jgi:hypothetical protein
MIDLSLAGLLGAAVGIVVAALAYRPLVALLVRSLQTRDPSGSEEGHSWKEEMPLLLRAVLAVDIVMFAGIGYWIGVRVAG